MKLVFSRCLVLAVLSISFFGCQSLFAQGGEGNNPTSNRSGPVIDALNMEREILTQWMENPLFKEFSADNKTLGLAPDEFLKNVTRSIEDLEKANKTIFTQLKSSKVWTQTGLRPFNEAQIKEYLLDLREQLSHEIERKIHFNTHELSFARTQIDQAILLLSSKKTGYVLATMTALTATIGAFLNYDFSFNSKVAITIAFTMGTFSYFLDWYLDSVKESKALSTIEFSQRNRKSAEAHLLNLRFFNEQHQMITEYLEKVFKVKLSCASLFKAH